MKVMKIKMLILLFTLLNVNVFAKNEYDVRKDGNSFSYIDTLCVTPDIAYNNAQNWVVKSSTSYKSTVQYEDREQKKMIIRTGVAYPYAKTSNTEMFLIFNLTIELKEEKFRIKLENIKERTYLHSINFGFVETGDDVSEVDIISFAGYINDVISGIPRFIHEEEYESNRLKLQELTNKKSIIKKKKELIQIDKEIEIISFRQQTLEEWRNNYIAINSVINSYVASLSKQLNTNDDF